ncbi:MAG: hypothetical protein A2284_14875 [Deltaproteobacteria bacterium RIFOXYA12_FULL_61_11]|nr:MAG: hypothetical protein A2284_14875 [Deltaproteobacteria bacterium RIFOXYA12_FULL_61_11]
MTKGILLYGFLLVLSLPTAPHATEDASPMSSGRQIDVLYFGGVDPNVDLRACELLERFLRTQPDLAVRKVTRHLIQAAGARLAGGNDLALFGSAPRITVLETGTAWYLVPGDASGDLATALHDTLRQWSSEREDVRLLGQDVLLPSDPVGEEPEVRGIGRLERGTFVPGEFWQPLVAYGYRLGSGERETTLVVVAKTFGGFSRLVPALRSLRAGSPFAVAVGTGAALPQNEAERAEALRGLSGLVEALVPSEHLLEQAPPATSVPFVAANILKGKTPLYPPLLVIERDEVRVCVIGLARVDHPERLQNLGLSVEPATISLASLEARATTECTLNVVVSELGDEEHRALVARYPWIDLLVGTRVADSPPYPREIFSQPSAEHRLNLSITGKITPGRSLGVVSFRFREAAIPSAILHTRHGLDTGVTAEAEFLDLDRRLSTLFSTSGRILLPDVHHLWPEHLFLEPGQLASFLGVAMFERTPSEVVLLPVPEGGTLPPGGLSAEQLATYYPAEDKLVSVSIPGSELKRLYDYVQRGNQHRPRYFLGGQQSRTLVTGLPIADATYYHLLTSSALLAELRAAYDQFTLERPEDRFRREGERFVPDPEGDPVSLHEALTSSLAAEVPEETIQRLEEGSTLPADQAVLQHLRDGLNGTADYDRVVYLVDVRNLRLDLADTSVERRESYANVRNAQVTANTQRAIGTLGEAYFLVDHAQASLKFGVLLDFSQVRLKETDGTTVENEQRDNGLLTGEGFYKWRTVEVFSTAYVLGPMLSLQYDTELRRNKATEGPALLPRERIGRLLTGLKLYDGALIKNFSAGLIMDLDYTGDHDDLEYGVFSLLNLTRAFSLPRYNIQYDLTLDTRWFAPSDQDTDDDLGLELLLRNQFKIPLLGYLSLTPMVDLFVFRGKLPATEHLGHNLTFGVALSYSRIIKPQFERWL